MNMLLEHGMLRIQDIFIIMRQYLHIQNNY